LFLAPLGIMLPSFSSFGYYTIPCHSVWGLCTLILLYSCLGFYATMRPLVTLYETIYPTPPLGSIHPFILWLLCDSPSLCLETMHNRRISSFRLFMQHFMLLSGYCATPYHPFMQPRNPLSNFGNQYCFLFNMRPGHYSFVWTLRGSCIKVP
jgi:hypothetical protein